jgi:hypothetical protein
MGLMYFTPSPVTPAAIMAVFGSYTCHLLTLTKHCIAGAGLPIRMIREVSSDQKEDDRGLLSIQSSLGSSSPLYCLIFVYCSERRYQSPNF